ncbi:MAG: excinuclease ABC subunit UvrC [bacterium]
MNNVLKDKLSTLPKTPGVYFHKNSEGKIIYIGKAAILRNRVRQYFQSSRYRDPKTDALVAEIADVEWIEVESEIDALFLEAELVRRYMPQYNIMLRDDKSLQYVRIDHKSDYPTVTLTRRPLDDKAEYYGPYINGWAVKRALKYLRRIFPYAIKKQEGTLGSTLYQQIGLDPGVESGKTSLKEYRSNLAKLGQYLTGQRVALVNQIEKDMKLAAKNQEFEQATKLRNQMFAIKELGKQIIFSDHEFLDISKDRALAGLTELLGLNSALHRIEGFDISHMSGSDVVASMVVFTNGIPDKTSYRKFKLKVQQNNDFASMSEVISRRLSEKNRKGWGVPNLFLIDGGKGQLGAALSVLQNAGLNSIPMIGLAKQEEEIVISLDSELAINKSKIIEQSNKLKAIVRESDNYLLIELPKDSDIVKLLQRIRDESHRFAVSYHTVLKRGRQTSSWLEDVPSIGPLTKKKLIKTFGSSRGVLQATDEELINLIGVKKTELIKRYISIEKK